MIWATIELNHRLRFLTFSLVAVAFLFTNQAPQVFAESRNIEIGTYYPSPFGSYEQMRLVPRSINLTGDCDSGLMYAQIPIGAVQYCFNRVWGALPGPWVKSDNATTDLYGNPADIYRLNGTYTTTHVPLIGIGTNTPQAMIHLSASDEGTPSMIHLNNSDLVNLSYNATAFGPGSKVSFRGYGAGRNGIEYVAIRAIYENQAQTAPQAQLRFYLKGDSCDDIGCERIRILGNGYWGVTDPSPTAVMTVTKPSAGDDYLKIGSDPASDGDIMIVNSNGRVGVNTLLPTQRFQVTGKIKATDLFLSSDLALKKNIKPVDHALDKVSRLRGVSFEWKGDSSPHMGFIAQDVASVFPNSVYGENGDKAIDYFSLIAPMIEAVKELKQNNELLRNRLDAGKKITKQQAAEIEALQKAQTLHD